MKNISDIDVNFKVKGITKEDIEYFDILEEPYFDIYGLYKPKETKVYSRLPESIRNEEKINPGVRELIYATSGGRVRFATDSPYIALKYVLKSISRIMPLAATAHAGFDLYTSGYGSDDLVFRHIFHPEDMYSEKDRYCGGLYEPVAQEKWRKREFMLHFPLYSGVDKVMVGIKKGCSFFEPMKYKKKKPIVFYGSSITMGGCASRPGNVYPAHLSRWLGYDYVNLGFAGSAKGEAELAHFISKMDMSAFVLDYEANAPTAEHIRQTHYNFYKIIREKHKNIPIVIMSFPRYPIYPDKGENFRDGIEARNIIRNNYMRAINEGDKNVYFIDGETLFGVRDQDSCTVDYCHPNDLGFYRMAERIFPVLEYALRRED